MCSCACVHIASKCLVGKGKNTASARCSRQWQHGKSCVHISKYASWCKKNTTSASCRWCPQQVQVGLCTIWWQENTTSASCWGSRPSWALGAGCSNLMQVAWGQGLVRVCALVQADPDLPLMKALVWAETSGNWQLTHVPRFFLASEVLSP